MKSFLLITLILLSATFYSSAQTSDKKKEIYHLVLQNINNNNLPIINETFTRIYNYDIDGNYNKWFYQRDKQKSFDTSEIIITTICVEPIKYSESVISFLSSKNITTDGFGKRTDNFKLDSISKYISDNRFISWKRAPLRNSFLGNIFKKNRVIGLSNIVLDDQNTIALVKTQVYSKNKKRSKNPSEIIILKRIGNDWKVVGSLDEMQPPKGMTAGVFGQEIKNDTTKLYTLNEKPRPATAMRGKVVDSKTKESIAGATVLLKGTITAVSTDAEGNFIMVIPESLLREKIVLVVSTVGYATKEFSIKKKNLQFHRDLYIINLTKNKQ